MHNRVMISNVKLELQKVLTDRKKSKYALAKETGIAYSTIHKMATKDIHSVDLDILEKICVNLGCEPNDLIVLSTVDH